MATPKPALRKHLNTLGVRGGSPGSIVSAERIRKFEAKWGVKLPAAYKWFLGRFGGAAFTESVWVRPAERSRWATREGVLSFGAFYGFTRGPLSLDAAMRT
jgi:hypothetical protein